MGETFPAFFRRATGYGPYDFQERLAAGGLPELLDVPTGAGKTYAAVLPWLWRRVSRGDVSAGTRLVYVLPLRTLVTQTENAIKRCLENLGLADEVGLHVFMGGADRDDDGWQLAPEKPSILVGTQDMVMSRALMRGYAEARSRWPVTYGLLHSDCQWVFDETQLLGPALDTSAQLQWLREKLGTAAGSSTMWMSATLDPARVATVDAPGRELRRVTLSDADRTGSLQKALDATRMVERLTLPSSAKEYPSALAEALLQRHVAGSDTIAVLNTVARAVDVFKALRGLEPDAEVLLAHSRFRPSERAALMEGLTADEGHRAGAGRIIVSTQVLEAGVDITSRTLYTEVAPWSSIVQRAGRCNRRGDDIGARLLWSLPPAASKLAAAAAPYDPVDLDATQAALVSLEGREVTSTDLQRTQVEAVFRPYAALRRRDLLQLFDTAADLAGDDIDVTSWIREGDDLTVYVAWRALQDDGRPLQDESMPARVELCPVPIGDARDRVRADARPGTRLWTYDRVEGRWRTANSGDVIPGGVFLADAAGGGYDVELGWSPSSRTRVPPVPVEGESADSIGVDPQASGSGEPIGLAQHLDDVRDKAQELVDGLSCPGLSEGQRTAIVAAARYHDLGKAHPVFQTTMEKSVPPGQGGPWAKSADERGRHERPHFRHELVTALILLAPGSPLLDGVAETDLVAYLAAAHHGKVRISVRAAPGESVNGQVRLLGVQPGDKVPATLLSDGTSASDLIVDLGCFQLGSDDAAERSWLERVLQLRDRPDLGPFRLAWCEALVRIADRRVSRGYRQGAAS